MTKRYQSYSVKPEIRDFSKSLSLEKSYRDEDDNMEKEDKIEEKQEESN